MNERIQTKHLEDTLTRRDFTLKTSLALLSGVLITISGCGGDSSSMGPTGSTPMNPVDDGYGPGGSADPSPPGTTGDVMGVVSANHGHVAIITRAEINAANMLELDIRGNADHSHTVELSGTELTQIGNGQQVSKISTTTTGGATFPREHNHTVTFN
jgi:hypothetical protein